MQNNRDLSIYDPERLSSDEARALVDQMLTRHPQLRRVFSEQYLEALIRRRNRQNYLLLLLVRVEDDDAHETWASILDDLLLLEPEGAFERFGPKLRAREYEAFQSGRTELLLAARMKRLGYSVSLEDATRRGRLCEFHVGTSPETFWEIKSVQDVRGVRARDRVQEEVQARMRRLPVPYVATFEPSRIAYADVVPAIREIKRQMSAHHAAGGALPAVFESHGLVISVAQTTQREAGGYLGMTDWGVMVLRDEQSSKIADRIKDAVAQLPDGAAGVVVIDTTAAAWVDRDDVIDACFGPLLLQMLPNSNVQHVRPRRRLLSRAAHAH